MDHDCALIEPLTPILNLLQERLRSAGYIRIDETPLQVLRSEKSPTSEHSMWVRVAGPPRERLILFDHDASRGAGVAERLLEGSTGYVQSDGHAAYDGVAGRLRLTHVGCMAHYPERSIIRSGWAVVRAGRPPMAVRTPDKTRRPVRRKRGTRAGRASGPMVVGVLAQDPNGARTVREHCASSAGSSRCSGWW